jgi:hypothetical protein
VERPFAAYHWDLWLVAWLCQGGRCSDDRFSDFRIWLISRGRAVYEAALDDADSLIEEMRTTEEPEFEELGCVPFKAYRTLTGKDIPELEIQHPNKPLGGDWLGPELKDRTGSLMLNRCVVFDELGDQEFEAIERRFPRIWSLCVEKGIITTATTTSPTDLPTPEQVAATMDPNLAKVDFAAYLKALGDAAQQVYKPQE